MKIGKTPEQQQAAAVVADKARTAATTAPAAGANGAATVAATANDPSAKVALSNTATSLIGTGTSHADFDADKVSSVSQSIDRGTYKVNPHVIADKLLSNARELLTKVTQ